MSLEITPLTAADAKKLIEDFNGSDRTYVLKRNDGQMTFEKAEQPLPTDYFEPTD